MQETAKWKQQPWHLPSVNIGTHPVGRCLRLERAPFSLETVSTFLNEPIYAFDFFFFVPQLESPLQAMITILLALVSLMSSTGAPEYTQSLFVNKKENTGCDLRYSLCLAEPRP